MDGSKKPFWKKTQKNFPGSIKPVYGAQHPPMKEPVRSTSSFSPKKEKSRVRRSSFSEFENKTEDAWDAGDDDICIISNVHISPREAETAALAVINNHKSRDQAGKTATATNETNRAENSDAEVTKDDSEDDSGERVIRDQPSPSGPVPGMAVRQMPIRHIPQYKRLLDRDHDREAAKIEKFKALLSAPTVKLEELRELSWSGIPQHVRPTTWRLLSGYLPANVERRKPTLERKRAEYFGFVQQYYHTRHDDIHQDTYRQIHIDIPRMNPLISLFQQEMVQEIFMRILYIWAIRHPASGYVQGINDLVTPFFVVFLSEVVDENVNVENFDVTQLPEDVIQSIEADSFWCTSKLLDGIQDNYTFAQPGIQIKVNALKELVKRINAPLHDHLAKQQVEYLQFAFRWMNNLLMREIPLRCTIRLWDTYQSEQDGFASFHLYVCAALLLEFSKELLKEKDFQGIMLMLQNLPTAHWGNEEVSQLLAQAYQLKYMFADAPNHIYQKQTAR